MSLAGAVLSHEVVVLAGDSGAWLDVGVCVVQERFAADLRLLFLQLTGGRVQLLLRFLRDGRWKITVTFCQTAHIQDVVYVWMCVSVYVCVCVLTPACWTLM